MKIRNFGRGLVLVSLLCTPLARAQVGVVEGMAAAEDAMSRTAELAADLKKEAVDAKIADQLREKVLEASRSFNASQSTLRAERERLMTNPSKNAAELKQLDEAVRKSDVARQRLVTLNKLMSDDATMKNAWKSGHLERTLKVAAEAVHDARGLAERVQASLSNTGDQQPGFFTVQRLEVPEGKLAIYAEENGREIELKPNSRIPIAALPIRLRACVQDEQKVRLTAQEREGGPGGVSFTPHPEVKPGHVFEYGNASGHSLWTAHEEYTWTPAGDTRGVLRGFAQTASDSATSRVHGDTAELHVPAVAQNLEFDIEGKARWTRESRLAGGARKADVEPKDGTARARLVISVFPR